MRALSLALLTACTIARHPEVEAELPAPAAMDLDLLRAPGPIVHTAYVSARWSVPLSGLVDLAAPAAREAGLTDGDTPIVLPVHVLEHPAAGTFMVDAGIPRSMMDGPGPLTGPLVRSFAGSMTPVVPLGDLIERHGLAGMLVTHVHLDHVLGLQDVPAAVPVYVGPGDLDKTRAMNALLRPTVEAALAGRPPLSTLPFATQGVPLGPVERALDLVGDGSLWALHVPGHTPGSTAFLARTPTGPVLFTGDCSHTIWGWEHGVTPGTYTDDHADNQRSLDALLELADLLHAEVFVGHELDGEGTGVARERGTPDVHVRTADSPQATDGAPVDFHGHEQR